jgi:hypothetical protein
MERIKRTRLKRLKRDSLKGNRQIRDRLKRNRKKETERQTIGLKTKEVD